MRKHLHEGKIQAYLDGALAQPEQDRFEIHLAACRRCQDLMHASQTRSQQIARLLSSLDSQTPSKPPASHLARSKLLKRLEDPIKEHNRMAKPLFSRLPRTAWVLMTLTLVLAVAFAFPSVRAAAVSFLGLFRVEQIQIVEIDSNGLPGGLESSSNLETIFSRNIQVEQSGEIQEVTNQAAASQSAGFAVRLPAGMQDAPHLFMQPGGSLTFTVDLELVRAVLKDIERQDIQLPDNLDGAIVNLQVSNSILALYGECKQQMPNNHTEMQDPDSPMRWEPGDCITLMQMPSPTINAPADLNLGQIGEAYLQVLGMSREEAANFSRNVNWTTTFVVPLPRNGTQYRDVSVDGVTGTLLEQYTTFTLIWIKNNTIYLLSASSATSQELLNLANSLE